MIIAIIIVIFIVLFILIQYNQLIRLRLRVKQSKSGIDVYLKQRFDLIPNLVSVVKGYANYEKGLLDNIVKLRAKYNETQDAKICEELINQMNKIIAIAENYPELKASEQFLNLQKSLSKIESQLQAARRLYNIDVTKYNTKIKTIPYNIIAVMFRFKEESLFTISEEEKKVINI